MKPQWYMETQIKFKYIWGNSQELDSKRSKNTKDPTEAEANWVFLRCRTYHFNSKLPQCVIISQTLVKNMLN